MIAIDTNVLVRFVVTDDASQARRARKLVEKNEVVVATTVLLEAEWVLRSAYGFDRAQVSLAFRRFLGLRQVAPESPATVAQALDAYDAGLDFADALHLAATPKAQRFFTFDRRLARAARDVVSIVPE